MHLILVHATVASLNGHCASTYLAFGTVSMKGMGNANMFSLINVLIYM